ncbi:AAA family ATPase [Halorientalis brevis]|uniref:AAA family ATPase n=1 Tax=Halorientalis brevis TaxID=1126241 RepID=A0ABD6CEK8_9EURY|nr:AAA family ATPase [Halorientalis brevis]
MIICIVGPSCAGKTTSAEYIESETGAKYLEASDFVRSRYAECGSEGEIMDFVKKEFSEEGRGTFAYQVCEQIEDSNSDLSIISGFRTQEEIEIIRSEFDSISVIGIYANSLLRYQRKLKRDNPKSGYTYRDFLQKDFTEYSFGIMGALTHQLDGLIINESTLDELYESVDKEILSQISVWE